MAGLQIDGPSGQYELTPGEVASMPTPAAAQFAIAIEAATNAGYRVQVIDTDNGGLLVRWKQ